MKTIDSALLNIAVRWAEHVGGDTKSFLDNFPGPTKLGNDLVVCQGSQGRMSPSVCGNLMVSHVLVAEGVRVRQHTGADDEEG